MNFLFNSGSTYSQAIGLGGQTKEVISMKSCFFSRGICALVLGITCLFLTLPSSASQPTGVLDAIGPEQHVSASVRHCQLVSADEAKKLIEVGSVRKVERVEWSGVELFGRKVFGKWRPVKRGHYFLGFYWGSDSPYFRLNGDNRTAFRGLGRESGFMQLVFPTSDTRNMLRDFMGTNDEALSWLESFDKQKATGEKICMVSKASVVVGEVMVYSGIFLGVATVDPDPIKMISGPGIGIWFLGRIGQLAGGLIQEKAFAFLDDAVDSFNAARVETSPACRYLSQASWRAKSSGPMPVVGFTFRW